ncbi:MAG: hypothetical protein OXD41_04055 [Thaumarchaeota archaeon]|nr:hypothetical protein [Nitrososphaerota archaeon]MDD9842887.1 hypothetical protein [Nitrososphaerota archaeon]
MGAEGHSESTVEAAGRRFLVRVTAYENGAFVSVHEGAARIGPITVSMHAAQAPVTTPVIPAREGSLFMRMVAEAVASRTRGIAAVTVSAAGLPPEASRAIMARVMEMV